MLKRRFKQILDRCGVHWIAFSPAGTAEQAGIAFHRLGRLPSPPWPIIDEPGNPLLIAETPLVVITTGWLGSMTPSTMILTGNFTMSLPGG